MVFREGWLADLAASRVRGRIRFSVGGASAGMKEADELA
jgi:hypothetical protein